MDLRVTAVFVEKLGGDPYCQFPSSVGAWVVSLVGVAAMEIPVLPGVQGNRLVGGHTVTADGFFVVLQEKQLGRSSPLWCGRAGRGWPSSCGFVRGAGLSVWPGDSLQKSPVVTEVLLRARLRVSLSLASVWKAASVRCRWSSTCRSRDSLLQSLRPANK